MDKRRWWRERRPRDDRGQRRAVQSDQKKSRGIM